MINIVVLVWVLGQVESGGNPKAVNDDCVGILQMRPIQVDEANRIIGKHEHFPPWNYDDRRNPVRSEAMARWIIEEWLENNKSLSVADVALSWKKGGRGYRMAKRSGLLTADDLDYRDRVLNLYREGIKEDGMNINGMKAWRYYLPVLKCNLLSLSNPVYSSTEGRFYPEATARLLERAARLFERNDKGDSAWWFDVHRWESDWRKAMEREAKR